MPEGRNLRPDAPDLKKVHGRDKREFALLQRLEWRIG